MIRMPRIPKNGPGEGFSCSQIHGKMGNVHGLLFSENESSSLWDDFE